MKHDREGATRGRRAAVGQKNTEIINIISSSSSSSIIMFIIVKGRGEANTRRPERRTRSRSAPVSSIRTIVQIQGLESQSSCHTFTSKRPLKAQFSQVLGPFSPD